MSDPVAPQGDPIAPSARGRRVWQCRGRAIELGDRTLVMGILNLTPDSFSDGGNALEPAAAVERALALEAEGADILDLGAESTRPGSVPVSHDEERRRLMPALAAIRARTRLAISVDTSKAAIAREALEAGADIVNDVTALRDPAMAETVARFNAGLILMHMQGTPATMQQDPRYGDVIGEIAMFLRNQAAAATRAGVSASNIVVDPGIGFGKTDDHNLELVARIAELRDIGAGLMAGVSRKGFLGRLLAEVPGFAQRSAQASERDIATAAASALCAWNGADIVRVHNVGVTIQALALVDRLMARKELSQSNTRVE